MKKLTIRNTDGNSLLYELRDKFQNLIEHYPNSFGVEPEDGPLGSEIIVYFDDSFRFKIEDI